ncbi:MAG TPA: Tad domain-containing protein [Planctomycetota bacterium]|nr:Tad domain-containing protein [Planctomycetota bacterium]HRR82653.1 Tad domain-containing protein [Planctomycetota bacterium]HRT95421.1 Tad domain-containing protein [Planctomycetota bacterium]
MRLTLKKLASDERGQALVFGALTLFMVAASVIFVADSGMVTSTRIQVQNAADECAYAGCLYEANVISSIAYLNEAMAYLYYDGVRYAANTTMLGVLAGLKRWGPPFPSDDLVYKDGPDNPFGDADPPDYTGDVVAHYDAAYARAKEWIPQIEQTLNMFARWEWGMALACAELVKMEIHRTALKHNIEAVAIYPDVDFFPGNGVQFDLHILKLMEGGEHVGWRVWTDDPPFYAEARKLGPFHWLITNTDRKTYEIQRISDTTYRVKSDDQDVTVERINDRHIKLKLIQQDNTGTTQTNVDAQYLQGLGWAVAMSSDDYSVSYVPMTNGGFQISVTNNKTGQSGSAGVRRDPATGNLQQWNGSQWNDVPGQNDTVTVGGVRIPVQVDTRINLGQNTWFNIPNELHLKDITYLIPNVFQMQNIWVTLLQDSCRIDAFIDIRTPGGSRRLRFTIEENDPEFLTVYGLMGINYRVPGNTTCKWFASADGDERDRMCRDCQLLERRCDTPESEETEWTYQYRLGKPYFIKEDLRRFAHHALCDRDPWARANNFTYPQWTEWYDVAQGAPNGTDYYQTRPQWGAPANYDFDGDGRNDSVRIYASDHGALTRDDTRSFDPWYQQVKPWQLRDVAEASLRYAPPIRLSEDFFYYALTVGCWKSRFDRQSTPLTLFRNPPWGYIGVASARAGFLELRSDDTDPAPHYRFTWKWPSQVEDFVNAGYENLYEPVWTSHLWPISDAIRSEHLDAYVDNQTGLSYLLYGLMHTHWYEPRRPDQLGEEPRLRTDVNHALGQMNLNTDDPRIGEVTKH